MSTDPRTGQKLSRVEQFKRRTEVVENTDDYEIDLTAVVSHADAPLTRLTSKTLTSIVCLNDVYSIDRNTDVGKLLVNPGNLGNTSDTTADQTAEQATLAPEVEAVPAAPAASTEESSAVNSAAKLPWPPMVRTTKEKVNPATVTPVAGYELEWYVPRREIVGEERQHLIELYRRHYPTHSVAFLPLRDDGNFVILEDAKGDHIVNCVNFGFPVFGGYCGVF